MLLSGLPEDSTKPAEPVNISVKAARASPPLSGPLIMAPGAQLGLGASSTRS